MSVIYFHQPEELAPGKKTPIDDDSTNWWAGAQRCLATATAAAVLAGSTFAATVDRNLQRQAEDIPPQPLAQAVDEDYWQSPAPPIVASLWQPLPIDFDAGELAPGAVSTAFDDEGFPLPRPIAAPSSFLCKPATDDDAPLFAVAPSFAPDEDLWRQPRVQAISWTSPAQQDEGTQCLIALSEDDAPPRVVIWLTRDCRDATMSRLYPSDPADLGQFSGAGPILARGAVSGSPTHVLASSTTIAHTAAESAAAAHICAAQGAAAHSLTPSAAPAHTFVVEVII